MALEVKIVLSYDLEIFELNAYHLLNMLFLRKGEESLIWRSVSGVHRMMTALFLAANERLWKRSFFV